ncbi:hypothetical protein [Sphingomonas faeni]|uniref:hypothetical protein n=1 Tax=Sphingomonas faeni TaxID=185950 RepID=UPI0033578336
MSIHGSKNWKAVESTDFNGGNRKLVVAGDVEVGASNEEPVLSDAVPQGINIKILILDLATPKHDGAGSEVLTWKCAEYRRTIEEDEFSQVDIRGHAIVDVLKEIS